MSAPPLIGITAGNDPRMPEHYILRWDYVHAVSAAGGIPVILAPGEASRHPAYLDCFSGLVLSGGVDVHPPRYGGSPREERYSPERDEFELSLTTAALRRGTPVLGVCRGLQVLNVARGGTLVADIPEAIGTRLSHDDPARPRDALAHEVSISPGSRLHGALGRERLAVNSYHHQAIATLGEGLVAVAFSDDGLIEGAELPGPSYVLGVQWHPEALWSRGGAYLALFCSLVEAARGATPGSPGGRQTVSGPRP